MRQVGHLQELHRDVGSTEHKILSYKLRELRNLNS
jgi:DNA-binding HxlR family transcriptional regulator